MIELIIAFLISVGFITPDTNVKEVQCTDQGGSTYGIVITDGTQQRDATVHYDKPSNSFWME